MSVREAAPPAPQRLTEKQREAMLTRLDKAMHAAAAQLEFEKAASLRDEIRRLEREWLALG